MTDEQYKDRRFVIFGDMGNIKQYVLDKKDNERFDSKLTLMDKLNELAEENEELKQRNNRQAKQLDNLYKLIEEKDWRTLTDIMDDFKKAEEQLQREGGT